MKDPTITAYDITVSPDTIYYELKPIGVSSLSDGMRELEDFQLFEIGVDTLPKDIRESILAPPQGLQVFAVVLDSGEIIYRGLAPVEETGFCRDSDG